MLRCFFLLLVLTVTASAQIPLGSSKREIFNLVGLPSTTSHDGDREFLNYRDFSITLENHQMTDLQFKTADHPPLSSYLLPEAKAALAASAAQHKAASGVEKPAPKPARSESVPAPAMAPEPIEPVATTAGPSPGTENAFSLVKSRIVWVVVLFVCLALIKIRVGISRQRNREKLIANFPAPPKLKQTGAPVLAVPRREKPSKPDPLKDGWSLDLLRKIEWYRFEQVVAAYERELGNDTELTPFGSMDCVDIRVYEKGSRTLKRIIQCKAFDNEPVSVESMRVFHDAMRQEKVPQASFYTTNGFTEAALAMGKTEPKLDLVDGPTFLNHIQRLHMPAQLHLFEVAVEDEYTTPTCPTCGMKMVKQSVGRGSHAESDFWGCRNVPRCKQAPIKRKQSA